MNCCIIGHRVVEDLDKKKLREIVLKLIKSGVDCFLFGTKSQFNDICYHVIKEFKEEFNLKFCCYVCRNETAFTKETETERVVCASLNHVDVDDVPIFDEIVRPEQILNLTRNSYIVRNKAMIDKSDCCLFYYDRKVRLKQEKIDHCQTRSGTTLAYEYAKKKLGVEKIFNVK